MATPLFEKLLDLALDQHGYIRAQDLKALDIDPTNLRKMAAKGRLERVAQGLYRIPMLAATANAQYAEATMWAEGRGCISHSSALAFHELCDVNPSRIHLTVPLNYSPRRAGGDLYRVHRRDLAPEDITKLDGIRVVVPAVAIAAAAKLGEDPAMVEAAIREAAARKDITRAEATKLKAELRNRLHRDARPAR